MKRLKLTPDEHKLLQDIIEHGPTSPQEIIGRLSLPEGKVNSFISSFSEDGIIEKKVESELVYSLTERGEKAQHSLSERVILDYLLEKGELPMRDMHTKLPLESDDIKAGIGVLRRAKLIKIERGILSLSDEEGARSFSLDLVDGLKAVSEGKMVPESVASKLLKRGFIEQEERTKVTVRPLISAKDLGAADVKEEVSRITPEMLSSGEWKKYSFKPYNIVYSPRRIFPGRYHPYRHFHDHVRRKLVGLGFKEMRGPMIEQEFWNFDALFSPQDHPAREDSDIFLIRDPTHGKLLPEDYVDNVRQTHEDGWTTGSRGHRYRWDPRKAARLLLRPQGTAISARTLAKLEPPAKYFSLAKCFRPDDIDATHGVEFYQAEGIICDPKITFRDLLGILKTFAIDVAGATEVSFRPDYYPFTSPSVELSAKHPTLGRIEFGGAGIFRPEVVRPFGIKYPVIAWGLGVDRLFMVKYQIDDIRELFSQNLQWLRDVEASSGISVEE